MTITAELADGRKLEFPDGTDPAVIQTTVKRLISQAAPSSPQEQTKPTLGQKVQASVPGRVIQGMRDPIDAGAQVLAHSSPDWLTDALDFLPSKLRNSENPFLQTIGERFFADPRAGATDKRIRETEQQYQQARNATTGGEPGFDAARFTGNVLSPTNSALAKVIPMAAVNTVPRMAATGGALGVTGGALTPVTDEREQANFGETKGTQMAVGGTTGAIVTPIAGKVMQAAAPYIGRFIDRFTGNSEASMTKAIAESSLETERILRRALNDLGQSIDDIPKAQYNDLRKQVSEALLKGRKLDAVSLLREQDFKAAGMPRTLGQITRDPTQFAKERNLRGLAGVGEPLMQTFDEQNKILQQGIGGYARGASDKVTGGERLAQALKSTDTSLSKGVSSAYKAARESSGKDLEVPLTGLAQDAAQVIDDFADKVPSAIRNKLGSYGILKTGDQTKLFTFDEANKLLTSINDHVGADRATNTALSKLRAAVKNAMLESGSDDVFAGARAAAAKRFQLHDAVPALKAAADGSVAPDAFVRKFVINGNASEVKGLAKVLKETSPEAFNEAKAQIGAQLQRAAFGENVAGDKILSPERLAKALRDFGKPKLEAFFTPQEIDQLNRFSRLGAYINSSPGAAPVSSSNSNIASMAANYAGQLPGPIGQLAAGLKSIAQPIANQRTLANALSAKVPYEMTKASPEAIRQAQYAAALLGLGAGQVATPR